MGSVMPGCPGPAQVVSVLIADDHQLVREGLSRLLELDGTVTVVGQAEDGESAVAQALRLNPDVVLMDISMPGIDGVEAIRRLRMHPECGSKVIALTAHGDERYVFRAIQSGASGYLVKDCGGSELVEAIHRVHRGEYSLSPEVLTKVLEVSASTAVREVAASTTRAGEERLTDREEEILGLIAQGFTNRVIAERLFISEKTVKNHITNVLRKIGVSDRTKAAIWAINRGYADRQWLRR